MSKPDKKTSIHISTFPCVCYVASNSTSISNTDVTSHNFRSNYLSSPVSFVLIATADDMNSFFQKRLWSCRLWNTAILHQSRGYKNTGLAKSLLQAHLRHNQRFFIIKLRTYEVCEVQDKRSRIKERKLYLSMVPYIYNR